MYATSQDHKALDNATIFNQHRSCSNIMLLVLWSALRLIMGNLMIICSSLPHISLQHHATSPALSISSVIGKMSIICKSCHSLDSQNIFYPIFAIKLPISSLSYRLQADVAISWLFLLLFAFHCIFTDSLYFGALYSQASPIFAFRSPISSLFHRLQADVAISWLFLLLFAFHRILTYCHHHCSFNSQEYAIFASMSPICSYFHRCRANLAISWPFLLLFTFYHLFTYSPHHCSFDTQAPLIFAFRSPIFALLHPLQAGLMISWIFLLLFAFCWIFTYSLSHRSLDSQNLFYPIFAIKSPISSLSHRRQADMAISWLFLLHFAFNRIFTYSLPHRSPDSQAKYSYQIFAIKSPISSLSHQLQANIAIPRLFLPIFAFHCIYTYDLHHQSFKLTQGCLISRTPPEATQLPLSHPSSFLNQRQDADKANPLDDDSGQSILQ
ncbi:hypothetical protein BYT27DRAFT_7334510 [Phlegmacium glaucopus]|nr:hypothetical protein BYT27DRAFT_7334510 [Phlegmacium glaucopus]